MDTVPFVNVAGLVIQFHAELVPYALQARSRERTLEELDAPPPGWERTRESLLERARGFDTDSHLKSWLHSRASLRAWRTLDFSFDLLSHELLSASESSVRVRAIVAELVGCPTLLNVTRLALRGLV
jgi:hypothetical protein